MRISEQLLKFNILHLDKHALPWVFLQDDQEFVEAIKDAKDWGTTHYLRKLFVLMLLTGTMNKPEEV